MKQYSDLIDRYLQQELSESERRRFEELLQTNPELKATYEQQLQLIEGAQRLGLKNQLRRSMDRIHRVKALKKIVLGTVVALAIAAGGWYALQSGVFDKENNIHYEQNETGGTTWSNADMALPSQVFWIRGDRDTVIETEQGIIFSIPAGAFIDRFGASPQGPLEIEIKEAMSPYDVMTAGLSTYSNGQLLETGGMFYINAREDGFNLAINQSNPIQVNVPTNAARNDMQLFDGERQADGSINWVNPKPLRKELSTVDILSLDFYPPDYLDSLAAMGYDAEKKAFTDSVYYHSLRVRALLLDHGQQRLTTK